ncbi:MAG: hypothetical protein DMG12_07905 [Acidobacteria bacterium]|nr:MAG: hypothetical protein DMG12_07905 [Acidobacteriota bacterium]
MDNVLCNSEIHDAEGPVIADHDVRRFQIAVDDTVLVHVFQRVTKPAGDLQSVWHRQEFDSLQQTIERLALEFAYLLCYPLVPCGLAALYLTGMGRFAEEFWNIVIPPAYLCYATFPFVQTLPPRAIENAVVWQPQQSRLRTLNLFLVRHVTTQANTFPSGHVAASLAIALELTRLAPAVGAIFLFFAIGIAGGAFIGRYHYAVDVLLGAGLAVISFVTVLFFSGSIAG